MNPKQLCHSFLPETANITPTNVIYRVSCKIALYENWVIRARELVGRFILASNEVSIDPETLLEYYKSRIQLNGDSSFSKISGSMFQKSI